MTRNALKENLSIDLLNQIAFTNWENHYDEESDHYFTDMDNRLGIESSSGWKADSFELEDAEISFSARKRPSFYRQGKVDNFYSLKWRISNAQGQEIVLDDWSKDRPFLRWVSNPEQSFVG